MATLAHDVAADKADVHVSWIYVMSRRSATTTALA